MKSRIRESLVAPIALAAALVVGGAVLLVGVPVAADPPSAKKTERAFVAKCGSCHGKDGKGQTEQGKKAGVEDMTTAKWQDGHTDAAIKKAIEDGVEAEIDGKKSQVMKGFGDRLDPEEIDALVQYVRAFRAPVP